MTKQVQRRRGTATQHTSFTGAEGEISVNTTNKSAHVHDGVTAGGFELARKDLDNVTTSSVASKVSGGTISTIDINGGTIDNTVIGGSTPVAGNFTTVDTTNIEVTNIKAKDGTASATIADSTGVMTVASSVLTTTDINGGTIDGTVIGGSSAAAGTFTTVTVDNINVDGNTISSTNTNGNITLDPNGTGNVVVASGNILVGTTTPHTTVVTSVTPQVQVHGAAASTSSILVERSSADANGPTVFLAKDRSGGIVSSGDSAGGIRFTGFDGTNYAEAAGIKVEIDGTPGAGDMPGRLVFTTTSDGCACPRAYEDRLLWQRGDWDKCSRRQIYCFRRCSTG